MRGIVALRVAAAACALAAPVAAQNGPLGTPVPGRPLGQPAAEAPPPLSFLAAQLEHENVAALRKTAEGRVRPYFEEHGVAFPPREIFIRVFKHERTLEVWARDDLAAPFTRIREYPVCALPGQLGPKKRLGDLQIPEGFYFIDEFNPRSQFHLSLRVNYPNLADRLRRENLTLGGDIYVHGGCATIGCVPIENENIEEVYWLAVRATHAGQRLIPIHIFPTRLDAERLRWLETFDPEPALLSFWHDLADGYAFFESTRLVPWVNVAADGRYQVPAVPETVQKAVGPVQ